MKKTFLLFFLTLITVTFSFAQNVAINSDASLPNNSAMLDVKSANKGLLMPRVALTGMDDITTIASPVASLMIYNTATTTGTTAVTPGYYYWNGTVWLQLAVIKEYAYIYNSGSRFVPALNSVIFSYNGNMSSGISHPPSDNSITLNTPGVYKMEFSVTANEINQFAFYKNGTEVPGSRYISASASQQNNGMVIVDILGGDIIQLRNTSGTNTLTLPGGIQVNASIMITQL